MQPGQSNALTKVTDVAKDVSKSLAPAPDSKVQAVRVVSEPDFGEQISKLAALISRGWARPSSS